MTRQYWDWLGSHVKKHCHFDLTFVYIYKVYYREEVFLSPSCGESNVFEFVHGLFMHAQFWLKIT